MSQYFHQTNLFTNSSSTIKQPVCFKTLVLSSGAAKGIAILGALQYLHVNDLLQSVDTFVGTSVGACLSYLLILGFAPVEIMAYTNAFNVGINLDVEQINLSNLFDKGGLMQFDVFEKHFKELTMRKLSGIPTLLELKSKYHKDLICVTYNLTVKKIQYISSDSHPDLSCLDALRMSSNIPILFEKLEINSHTYVDGAIAEPFAWDYAVKNFTSVLGVVLEKQPGHIREKTATRPVKPLNRNFRESLRDLVSYIFELLSVKHNVVSEISSRAVGWRDKIIHIPVKFSNTAGIDLYLANKDKIKLFSIGYETAKSDMSKIRNNVNDRDNSNVSDNSDNGIVANLADDSLKVKFE